MRYGGGGGGVFSGGGWGWVGAVSAGGGWGWEGGALAGGGWGWGSGNLGVILSSSSGFVKTFPVTIISSQRVTHLDRQLMMSTPYLCQ